jgi:predicted ribosomally synthesized peptide with nif11-like leader
MEHYMRSQELNHFFAKITGDQDLQERLYLTKEIADVAIIGQEMGFKITGADILRAQAGRLLMLPPQELEDVAAGKKAKTGAQWGREGRGYLDSAGFWVKEFIQWGYTDPAFEQPLEAFLAKVKDDKEMQAKLLLAKTYNDVASIANEHGYEVSGSILLRYQAIQILKLDDEKAERVACGAS